MSVENELVKKHLQRPLGAAQRGWALFGLGFCGVVLAWLEYRQPSARPFTGRWGWAQELMFTYLGAHGVAVGTGLVGLLLILSGVCIVVTSRRSGANAHD